MYRTVFGLLVIFTSSVLGDSLLGEYLLESLSDTSTAVSASNVPMDQIMPDLTWPGSSNDPSNATNGVEIDYLEYLEFDGDFACSDSLICKLPEYNLFNVWIYHVDGVLGEFVNIDVDFKNSETGYFTVAGIVNGANQFIQICMYTS